MRVKVKNKISLITISLVMLLLIAIISMSVNDKGEIIILDSNGDEYFRYSKDFSEKDFENKETTIVAENDFVDGLIKEVYSDLVDKKGYSEKKAVKVLNTKGVAIKATVDANIQETITDIYRKRETFTTRKKSEYVQSSFVLMDYDGNIKGVANGNNDDKTINRATEKLIKVGSAIKPISIYAKAIDKDIINYSSLNDDEQGMIYVDGRTVAWPRNYDNKYEPNITTTRALQQSKNTVAVNIGRILGEENIYNFLKNDLEYKTMVDTNGQETDKQLSALALGHLNKGITLDELVSAYTMFGNGGYFKSSNMYIEVKDSKGDLILDNSNEGKKLISDETSYIMNRLLINNIEGNHAIAKNAAISGIEVGGKTGTVGDDERNTISKLFVGMTPEYIGGIWIGHDLESPMYLNSYKEPTVIWKDIISNIDLKKNDFNKWGNTTEEEFCLVSGLLKGDKCSKGEMGYYKANKLPKACNICN